MSESPPFLRRVRIRNYKSIVECDVELGKFNVIVGRNGSGKSNFLDALRFVAEALQSSLDFAIQSRGGINDIINKCAQAGELLEIRVELNLLRTQNCVYEFHIVPLPQGRYRIQSESILIESSPGRTRSFRTEGGNLVDGKVDSMASVDIFPKAAPDRLYLVTMSGLPDFRAAHNSLTNMCFYNFDVEQIRQPHSADASTTLRRNGANLASLVKRLFDESPDLKTRLLEYLRVIVPQIVDIESESLTGLDYLLFKVQLRGQMQDWLHANNISDGTLRALADLIASMQYPTYGNLLSLVAIEEPETALHPAAVAALLDALRETAQGMQIIITTHSADLVDQLDLETDTLLVAEMNEGESTINCVNAAGRSVIRDHLFTPGELLRMDQLQPKPLESVP